MHENHEYQQKALQKLGESIHDGKWDSDSLVQLIELAGTYANLKTIPDYAREHGLTYNGVKKTRKIVTLFGVKFVSEFL